MTSNKDVAIAFANQRTKLKSLSMFLEGNVIYSYGYHFPIAKWIGTDAVLFNIDSYSSTTAKHISHVRSALNGLMRQIIIIEVTTEEIKQNSGWIKREFESKSIEHSLELLRNQLKKEGASPQRVGWFIKKLKEQLKSFRFIEAL